MHRGRFGFWVTMSTIQYIHSIDCVFSLLVHCQWLSFPLTKIFVFLLFYSFPSELFSCTVTSSFTSSSVLSILISFSFHLDESICQNNTIFLLAFIFRVTLILVPFLFFPSLIKKAKQLLFFFSWRIPTPSREKVIMQHDLPHLTSISSPFPGFSPALFYSHMHCRRTSVQYPVPVCLWVCGFVFSFYHGIFTFPLLFPSYC